MLGVIGFIINGVRGSGVVGFWGLGFAVWGLGFTVTGFRVEVNCSLLLAVVAFDYSSDSTMAALIVWVDSGLSNRNCC